MSDVQVAEFRADDEARLLELFRSHFTEGSALLRPEYLQWLYLRNPNGPAIATSIAESGKWIAFMALIPVHALRANERLKTYFVVNVLVHPAHQGKNLFGRMIRAAREFTEAEGSALMGHPNRLALTMWQRARMQFHEPLRPALILPSIRGPRRKIDSFAHSQSFCTAVNVKSTSQSRWRLELTPEFLTWRFLEHPVYKYSCSMQMEGDAEVALDVTRPWRPGVHLLLDTFYAQDSKRKLAGFYHPVLMMQPESTRSEERRAVRIPSKKEFPFFLTSASGRIEPGSAADLRLCASDF